MRPLELEIEGFTCYRERQPVLDLREMRLFAISGPTGAGKSSVLDAMLFALYGKVPRVDGKRGLGAADLISHGRDVLSVRLDFRLRGKTYRVVRRLKQRKTQAVCTPSLEELTPAGTKSLADSVTTVDAALAELLGLDFDGFTRTVVLPQNQFAAFLRSKAKERRDILQQLLRHSIYEVMRASAAERHKLLGRDLEGKREQLDQLGAATPDALAELDERLAAARVASDTTAKEEEAAAANLQDLTRRRDLTKELAARRAELSALEARTHDIETKERELDLARRAAVVVPAVESAARASERARRSRAQLDEARRRMSTLTSEHETKQAALALAEQAASGIEPLRAAISRLDEIRVDLERRPQLERALAASRKAVADASASLETSVRGAAVASLAANDAKAALSACETALASVQYDEARHHALDGGRDRASLARALGVEITSLRKRHEQLLREQAASAGELAATREAHATAQAGWDGARAALDVAERAERDGRDRHTAEALRRHLVAGAECPVCRQAVASVPGASDVPLLDALHAATTRAKQVEERARKALDAAGRAHAAAQAQVAAVAKHVQEGGTALALKVQEHLSCLAALRELLATREGEAGQDVVGAFDAALAAAQSASRELLAKRDALGLALRRHGDAVHAATQAESLVREGEARRTAHQADETRLVEELRGVTARIAAATSAPDPVAERARLAARVVELETSVAAARQALAAVAEALASAAGNVASLERTLTTDVEEHAQRDLASREALQQSGFASAEDASTAARPPARVDALDREIRGYREGRTVVSQRIAQLTDAIGGREVDADAHAAALDRHSAARALHGTARDAVTRLGEQREQLRARVELAARLGESVQQLASALAVAQQMAHDLRSDGFQDYLLEETFRRIVSGASTRLHSMTRRYTMEWIDGEFHVVDHDNAGERRPAETLSGGETFMASLCLALQLSEEVLHASGALQMDSLFIDEGFGTLDSQALSEVADALETLGADGGRLIGVISHRQELTERLPGVIRIEKGNGESKWVVERAG